MRTKITVKSRLLELLEKNKGTVISGEKIAEELQCTRAAVWKAVKTLREEGYEIAAGPNKGYMLSVDSNKLAEEGIRPFLSKPDVFLKVYPETESTNRMAKQAAISGEGRVMEARCWLTGRRLEEAGGDGSFIHRMTRGCISA